MKKIKGIVFAAGFVLCGFITGSCVNTVEAGQKDVSEFKKVDNDHSRLYTYIMTDNRKDVEYIVVTGGRGVAITPRLNK
jgi:hypothetical protein